MRSQVAIFAAFCACMFLTSAHAQSGNGERQRVLLDANWRFHMAASAIVKNAVPITGWRWKADPAGLADARVEAAPSLDTRGGDWKDTTPGQNIFGGPGFAWVRATLPNVPGPRRVLRLAVDDNADVFVNGHKLMHHEGWDESFDVPLDSAWKTGGPNTIAILVQNFSGPGGLEAPTEIGTNPVVLGGSGAPWQTLYNDRSWRVVHLPNDYIIDGTFTPTAVAGHGSLPVAPAWYRKTFTLPASDKGKDLWIGFEGVYRDSTVYLNGVRLGNHQSGYTSFRYDITRAAHYGGKNVLAVSVNPDHFEGWWYEGGGIYRHVWLNVVSPVHVAPWGTFVTAKLPEPKPGRPVAPATLTIQTIVADADERGTKCQVKSVVFDDTGKAVATVSAPASVGAGQRETLTQQAVVQHPRLWSLQKTNMYRLHTELIQNGKVIDAVDTPFGIRTIRYDPNSGFYLDGKHVEIQGVCNHQDFPGVGIGVPDNLEAWRVATLKAIGVNGWRMSHNPPTPGLLDACDHEGMLVMDENRHLGDTYTDHTAAGTPDTNLSDLGDMIQRDRNHPSIIMWSMCNEEGLEGTPQGAKIFSAMMTVVHKYDKSRPISCAMNAGWFDPGFATVEDLLGINYGIGNSDKFHQLHPKMPIFGSETASTLTTRGVYADVHTATDAWVTSYNMTDGSWQAIANRPFLAGSFDWTGFDYKGEPTPYGWPDINSNFGILDMCGFPKDNAYYLKSWWTAKPVLHLMPHWNWAGKEGKPIRVICFSNAARVELFLNGKSLGAQTMPHVGHLEWSVPYAPGALVAKGYNAQGKLVSTFLDATTGTPAALRLSADQTTLPADGESVEPVRVEVVDAAGRVVPTANNRVTFHVTGAGSIAGVGNGNPSDHDPDRADYRLAFNGLCMVVVGAGQSPGRIHLTATSPGLKSAALELTTQGGSH